MRVEKLSVPRIRMENEYAKTRINHHYPLMLLCARFIAIAASSEKETPTYQASCSLIRKMHNQILQAHTREGQDERRAGQPRPVNCYSAESKKSI